MLTCLDYFVLLSRKCNPNLSDSDLANISLISLSHGLSCLHFMQEKCCSLERLYQVTEKIAVELTHKLESYGFRTDTYTSALPIYSALVFCFPEDLSGINLKNTVHFGSAFIIIILNIY